MGAIPGNDHEIKRQKYVAVYQRSDGWPREVLHVAKAKTIRNWDLNTTRFLCGQMSWYYIYNMSEIIISKIYTRGYAQCL